MIRCYITDRKTCPVPILECIERNIATGVDLIQIREKDLNARDLLKLVTAAVDLARGTATRIIVNTRADVAMAAGAHGVHLTGTGLEPSLIRGLGPLTISVACHSIDDVQRAAAEGADLAVLSPIFPSPGKGAPLGLKKLQEACRQVAIPVLALGGVTRQNTADCLNAGAGGIAAIRLFQVP